MKKIFIVFLTIVHWQIGQAQFYEDFLDNDFTINPIWNGDVGKFTISSNQLKLQALAVASTAFLSTPSQSINNASWEFYVQMDFNPSSANQARIYLVSDNADLSGSIQGYFVKIGNTADEISLYRQDGSVEIKIIDGADGKLNSNTVKVRVKITRDDKGNWQLFSDTGLGIYTQEGGVNDLTYQASTFFGIRCEYSATRSDKFYFDNFIVTGDPFVDIIAPELINVRIISMRELELVFSESLDNSVAQDVQDYSVNHDLLNPIRADLYSDQKTVKITFGKNFPNGISCVLSIAQLKDMAGNPIHPTSTDFLFFQASETVWRDVVVTEIFANPNPIIGLPEAEYIELLNRSDNPIDLNKWSFTDGMSIGNLSSFIVLPGEYIILTQSLNLQKFSSFPKVLAVKNFPTLNNSGDILLLKSAGGSTIDSLNYTDLWYKDDDKKEGGWSLEKVDPNNICAEADNWLASEDKKGGTPGTQNSVYANKPDLTGPMLVSAIPTSSQSILLSFNEKLEKKNIGKSVFSFEPPLAVSRTSYVDESLSSLNLILKDTLRSQTPYYLTANNVYDCSGNNIQSNFSKVDFGLPEQADSLNILINEILFNPTPTGVDFVELYNNSPKFINLKGWSLSNHADAILTNGKLITSSDLLLKPHSYLALTENANVLKSEYPLGQIENFIQAKTLPGLNDDDGAVALLNKNGKVIDFFLYSKSMHSNFIKNEEGVSLERISFAQPTNDNQNWKSASSVEGYATPGYINSNARPDTPSLEELVTVDPEIFIPDYGEPNFTQIAYNFEKGGYIANVKICDIAGREIKQLVDNQTLDTQGFIRWDGDSNNGSKARVGYYFVLFEVFDTSGSVQMFRKRVVVATKF